MKKLKTLLPIGIAAMGTLIFSSTVKAQLVLSPREVGLSLNQGVTIIPQSPISKVWLDDTQTIEVMYDRPLEQGSTIIHVVQKEKSTDSVTVTLVSQNSDIQKIKLNLGSKTSQDTLDLRQVKTATKNAAPIVASPPKPELNADIDSTKIANISAGLKQALGQGAIRRDSELHTKLETYLDLLNQGSSFEQASNDTGIIQPVIDKLEQIGVTLAAKKAPQVKEVSSPDKSTDVAMPLTEETPLNEEDPHTLANILVSGLTVAKREKVLANRSRESAQVNSVVRYLRTRKYSLEEARKAARLSQDTLNKILDFGRAAIQHRLSLR